MSWNQKPKLQNSIMSSSQLVLTLELLRGSEVFLPVWETQGLIPVPSFLVQKWRVAALL